MQHDRHASAFHEFEEWTWRKIEGDEHTWYVPLIPNAGDWIHRADPKQRGYEGKRLTFTVQDGDGTRKERVRGPWHASTQDLREDTGLNLRELTQTKVKVRIGDGKLIYSEIEPVLGETSRGLRVAEQLANLHEEPVTVETIPTNGGRKWRTVSPNGEAEDTSSP